MITNIKRKICLIVLLMIPGTFPLVVLGVLIDRYKKGKFTKETLMNKLCSVKELCSKTIKKRKNEI